MDSTGASPSAMLRADWLLGAEASAAWDAEQGAITSPGLFFEPPGADGFVNPVGQHAKFRANGWNFHSRVETTLDFLKALLRELVTLLGRRWTKKSCRSLVAQLLAVPLHADQRHSQGA